MQALQHQQQQSGTTAQQAQRRVAAAQAAGVGASAVVDTRLLGKPLALDGRETSWRSFKFQFLAYCGAIDSHLKDLLVLGETRDVVAMRIHMGPDTRALSAQLHYMLIMVCQEGWQRLLEHAGDTEGRMRGGDCWTSTSQGPQDGNVLCCKSSFTTVSWRPASSLGRVRGAASPVQRAVWRGRQ